ncbi:peptidylprolyl isomerase [Oculatella sp. LEGE 06141]|uniref:peptidylprolyl isomerase n=1 Tax=Oculatella sp. LEGE 06141 TaxID=1828648 RepID=UPI00187F7927|nr:peptidylprolyl isomerase [Oculatella sp. LEGE 06141]MBE9180632.1 peptidylprolyl isomerase [Oculatella sp. LEGE 06141]
MASTLEQTPTQSTQPTLPAIAPATDAEILAYLRCTCKIAELSTAAEQNSLILKLCEQFNITLSDEEWQAAGDAFRTEHRLLGATETLDWLNRQRIAVEDWSQGIRVTLLTKKLQEHLFGENVDSHYLNNREQYKRVAVSQILVNELSEALRLLQLLRQEQVSFCAAALEYSKGKHSKENGGFVGVRFLAELIPEIASAVADAEVGQLVGPISTKFGCHIVRVEKWFVAELTPDVRDYILATLFQLWLQNHDSVVAQSWQDNL